jgi:hypothetical protein
MAASKFSLALEQAKHIEIDAKTSSNAKPTAK